MHSTPMWLSGKLSTCQCRRHGFDPWSGRPLGVGNATHSSILAWESPWTEQPGGLQSMGSQRVQHDCAHVHSCSVHQCYFCGVHRPVLVQECLLLVHDKKVKVSF